MTLNLLTPQALAVPGIVGTEHVLTASGDEAAVLDQAIHAEALRRDARVVSRFVFSGKDEVARWDAGSGVDAGATARLHGDVAPARGPVTVQAIALNGVETTPVLHDGQVVGWIADDGQVRSCRLTGLVPTDPRVSREVQARDVFTSASAILAAHGFCFADTVRTWLYLDRLLDWYDTFNRVRTDFFQEHGVFARLVPASTGIGAGTCAGAAISLSLLALRSADSQASAGQVTVEAVASPLQCPAIGYRSAFSRAVEIRRGGVRSLLISGTASIAPDGTSAHRADPERQIELTLKVVDAILRSRAMDWSHTSRAIAYATDPAYFSILDAVCRRLGLPAFPYAPVHAIVCRDDLLFELELDAVASASAG